MAKIIFLDRRNKAAWKILGAAAVLLAVFLPGISRYHRLKERDAKLESEIKRLKKLEADLRKEQSNLQQDPAYIERVAREKLQVTKEGEMIVRVEDGNVR